MNIVHKCLTTENCQFFFDESDEMCTAHAIFVTGSVGSSLVRFVGHGSASVVYR